MVEIKAEISGPGAEALKEVASGGRGAASSTPATGSLSSYLSDDDESADDREPFDEDEARDRAEDELASDTYVGSGASYGCTDDCSVHEAGWRYRADHGFAGSNPDSPSFDEGGRAFDDAVDEKVEEARDTSEAGEDQD